LTNLVRGGSLTFAGQANPALTSLTVNSQSTAQYSDQTFATTTGLALANGTNTFTVIAADAAGDRITNIYTANLPATNRCKYDANGNLVTDGVRGFDYDGLNELVRVTVTNAWKTEYDYDGLGRHHDRREYVWWPGTASWYLVNECYYVYAGHQVVQEVNTTEGTASYVYGLSLLERDSTVTNQPMVFYHTDANGNVTTLFDGTGQVQGRYLYDPYGNLLARSGPMADVNRYRFSGQEWDPHTGLYYYGYRFYDPNFHRWLNQDPLGDNLFLGFRFNANGSIFLGRRAVELIEGPNLYKFVKNNPGNNRDLLGLEEYSWQAGMYVPSPQDFDQDGYPVGNSDDYLAQSLMGAWGKGVASAYEGAAALLGGAVGLDEGLAALLEAKTLLTYCDASGKIVLGSYGVISGTTKLTGNELPSSVSVPGDFISTGADFYNRDYFNFGLDLEGWAHSLFDWVNEDEENDSADETHSTPPEHIYFASSTFVMGKRV
jgi:RHS repeat-associated protein